MTESAPKSAAPGRLVAKSVTGESAPPKVRLLSRIWRALRGALVLFVLVGLAAGFVGTLYFLYQRSKGEPPVVKTEKPTISDIVKKAVATGSIVPRREVLIKPRVSGIVKKLHVVAGDSIKEGDLIAEVTIIPDVAALTRAEGELRSASVAKKHAELELARTSNLKEAGVVSARDVEARKLDFDLRATELIAASEALQVAREGALGKSDKNRNTSIRATVTGTIIDVPVLEGSSVIESNAFNEGTTVAVVADMTDMIFLGKVDEADVGKISTGMEATIQIGAIENRSFPGTLEFIASKGKVVEGAIQFELKVAMKPIEGVVIRAGYSANAGIVLEKKTGVLAIDEKLLQFEGDKAYVEVRTGPDSFERRDISVGISDGIKIEVKEGLDEAAEIKVPAMGPPGSKG